MPTKIFKFRIEFITTEEDVDDEVIGIISHDKKMVELVDFSSKAIMGFIPFSAIKKLEIIEEVGAID